MLQYILHEDTELIPFTSSTLCNSKHHLQDYIKENVSIVSTTPRNTLMPHVS